MDAATLQHQIVTETIAQSGFDPHRRYLQMSAISRCPRALYFLMIDGPETPLPSSALLFYVGNLFERDLLGRLADLNLINPNSQQIEITARFDPRFKGHADAVLLDGILLEVKKTTQYQLDAIMASHRVKRTHFEQVQMYLTHGHFDKAIVLYCASDTGALFALDVHPVLSVINRLNDKARGVLTAVDQQQPPPCLCSHCLK